MVAKYFLAAAPVALIVAPAPAFAGEEVAYAAAPSWVVPADIDAAMKNRQELVLADRQVMLKDGVVQRYVDMAYDLRSSEILGRLGTLQFAWMPDKGDLIVHRLELRRGKEVIDLLAQGVKPEVIRRESELERRSIDGMLTAVVKVPGARVGDVLRFTVSTTLKDQALRDEMQAIEGYMAAHRTDGNAAELAAVLVIAVCADGGIHDDQAVSHQQRDNDGQRQVQPRETARLGCSRCRRVGAAKRIDLR